MDNRKLVLILTLVFALVLVSCNSEIFSEENEALASVNLTVLSDVKDITATNSATEIVSYTFKATSDVSDAKGKSVAFESYGARTDGAGTIVSRFSPGYWSFTIRGSNSSGGVIYEGSKTVYLAPGENNVNVVISPVINTEEGLTGTLGINISAPMISSSQTSFFTLSYLNLTDENAQSVQISIPSNALTYTAELCSLSLTDSTLAPGLYLLNVAYFENSTSNTAVSTAVTPFRIIENSTTTVSGTLEGFLYSSVNLSVSRQSLSASMAYSSEGNTFTITPGGSGYSNLTYRWYINGTKTAETTAVLDVSSCFGEALMTAGAGYYCVTCVLMAQNTANSTYEAVCCRGHFTINAAGEFVDAASSQ